MQQRKGKVKQKVQGEENEDTPPWAAGLRLTRKSLLSSQGCAAGGVFAHSHRPRRFKSPALLGCLEQRAEP